MSAGGVEYTLYFAYVAPGTVWDVSLARFDENIFDLVIEHDEGQIPTAAVEIKNPRIGLINPSRLFWVWISFSWEACPPQPLFFGRLVGIPEEVEQNTIQMKLIARDDDYIYQKQQVARSLKVLPNYDSIFFEASKRDDPDAILEGWAALYHVDRVNGRVSASDILVGEDGTVTFAAQDVFYDSLQCKILQSPLVAVNVKADVQWEQQYRGAFYVGNWAFPTLGSDAFVGDWPKSGSSLGGGWYAGVSWAGERDPSIEQQALLNLQPEIQQQSVSYTWVNEAKTHKFGDTMSVSVNYTPPFGTAILIKEFQQFGLQDSTAVDGFGDPAPVNRPAKLIEDWFCYLPFALNFQGKQSLASLGLVYQANRKRSERIEMTVQADVQPVLIDPLVVEDTEQITLRSGDLSLPQVNMLNWDSVGMGGAVGVGQIIFPDNPLVPGQTSSQIAVQAGNTGMTIPTFSNIAGQTTADGGVIWASLGDTPPSEGAQDWVRLARVPLGALLLPKPISGVPDLASTLIPGSLNYPPTGTAVPIYSIFCSGSGGPGDTMNECTTSGLLGGIGLGQHAVFQTFTNPSGMFLYIAVQAGTTGEFHTTFNESTGSQTTDGGVIWQNIGPADLPIGGWPGMTPAATYFPTDRGQQSVQHMLCRARAKLRKRARAVEVSFDTRFEVAAQLSCRMNGNVTDPRLPGGTVSGKVVSYKLEAHGDSGVLKGSVVLGCSIGKNILSLLRDAPQPLFSVTDIPSYVGVAGAVNGYVQPGYQQYYSANTLLTPGDPNWVPPGTPPPQPTVGGGTGPSGQGPITPPNWPVLPPTLPPITCPPLNSVWAAGPSDIAGNDISYTPPVSDPNDDGITFPPSQSDLILRQGWHGIASTINPINIALFNLQLEQTIHDAIAQANPTKNLSVPVGGIAGAPATIPATAFFDIQVAVEKAVLQGMLQGTGLWYELVLKPLTNGPFANAYVVNTTNLLLPQTINLSAPSTG